MAFPWTSKKDPGTDEAAAENAANAANDDPVLHLAEQLAQLDAGLRDINRQMVAYLAKRLAPADDAADLSAVGRKLDAIAKRLDGLSPGKVAETSARPALAADALREAVQPLTEKLAQLEQKWAQLEQKLAVPKAAAAPAGAASAVDAAAIEQAVAPLRAALAEIQQGTGRAIAQLREQIEAGLGELIGYLRPAQDDARPPAGAAEWQRAILGRSLAEQPDLAFPRQKLIDEVLEGKGPAMALAGQLLVFQSAPPEKMSALLKDIGEAYYRWQPKTRPGATKLEELLVGWLQRACDDANLPNTIELVNPGERFDAGRHTATQRGVEITQVMGWVVLRDTGRVYTKALVDVK